MTDLNLILQYNWDWLSKNIYPFSKWRLLKIIMQPGLRISSLISFIGKPFEGKENILEWFHKYVYMQLFATHFHSYLLNASCNKIINYCFYVYIQSSWSVIPPTPKSWNWAIDFFHCDMRECGLSRFVENAKPLSSSQHLSTYVNWASPVKL